MPLDSLFRGRLCQSAISALGICFLTINPVVLSATASESGKVAQPAAGRGVPRVANASEISSSCAPEAVQAVAASLPIKVTVAEIRNGPKFDGGTRYVAATANRPGFCQVTGTVVTNKRTGKTANFLATLPDNWNRKYLQFGCFGHCGFFSLNDATSPLVTIVAQGYPGQILEKGYASFGTDQGHDSQLSGAWAVKGPGQVDDDAIEDFLYRSNKVLAQAGKAFTAAFYSRASGRSQAITYAYFCGCSGGGRDALVAASYFPEEFDGIIAGSPYANMVDVGFQVVGTYLATIRSLAADVPPALLARIDPIVKAQCDIVDGVEDGLIQNPAACNFRPSRDLPRCEGDKPGSTCFTSAQIETVSALVTAITDESGKVVQPGYAVSEILPFFRGTRPADINGAMPWDDNALAQDSLVPLGNSVLKTFAMRNDPTFNTRSLFRFGAGGNGQVTDFRAIVPRAYARRAYRTLRKGIGSDPRNAAKLISLNRKLLIWHNSSDEKLTPYMSVNYYKQLASLHGGYERLQHNIRLFMVPGTSHCSIGAVGPGNFDALSALENWVERGDGPDSLTARLYDRVSPMIDETKTPLRTMPLCKFPEMARYKGGDVNQAANWTCDAEDARMLQVGESGLQAGVLR